MSKESVLKVENVTMQFGGVIAVDNMNLEVNKGEIVSLIGPNGAGKTTAFNVITGVYAPTNGAVYYKDRMIIQNCPQGKMKKLYRGKMRTYTPGGMCWLLRRTRLPVWVLQEPFRISGFLRARRYLKIFSLPNICFGRVIFSLPLSA